jgi:hypothetical protein
MSTIDSEVIEEPDGILGVHGHRRCQGLGRAAASADPAPVVADALEPVEDRILDEWPHGVGEVGAVDGQDRLAPTLDLVGELDAVDLDVSHWLSSVELWARSRGRAPQGPSRRDAACGA